GYYLNAPFLRYIYQKTSPDVVNAHYASGYGTLARIAGVKCLLLSAWGSDVYDFPRISKRRFNIVKKNIFYADAIASTSKSMAKHVEESFNYPRKCFITPFGIDVGFFKPNEIVKTNSRKVVIGTVKTLSNKYGIDTLIEAFSRVKKKLDEEY